MLWMDESGRQPKKSVTRFLHGDFVAAVSNSTGQVGVVWLMSIFRWIFFSLLMDLL
ncbi:hypothetical protein RHMOL_Rhmol03G0271600 [Rhododendron molle]|uniref:Uncharacterized protein n=3 Tax=Rhododendron molle TaxID=49168 RepID=A0ACC0NI63_RHOML|nr:hypothetical protein RHMOL_Rhmol13G0224100 [Rhododendron molle]KAI8552437.1 hypothetical protein RHMOL_Rhmol06G0266600 [Rhododendron molle]KAI8565586.1 hypothetical protein RHMOL_Rhmol03G0271600 [Rhododendron molle]